MTDAGRVPTMCSALRAKEEGRVGVGEAIVETSISLPPRPASVAAARRALRDVAARVETATWGDDLAVAVSELVTNAIVHTGSQAALTIRASDAFVRIEVTDSGRQLPARRHFDEIAGTGRGLRLVDELVDRWGYETRPDGKTVWAEIGDPPAGRHRRSPQRSAVSARPTGLRGALPREEHGEQVAPSRTVALLEVPLLIHHAWQEHAAELLREYLLLAITEDPGAVEAHAAASEVLNWLADQIPDPILPTDPDALLSEATEANVTVHEMMVEIPSAVLAHVPALDRLLLAATDEARAGNLMSPPSQPEIVEMREWLCGQLIDQARAGKAPSPWRADVDAHAVVADSRDLAARYADLALVDYPLIAADTDSVIVAASAAALDLLGYPDLADLLGRRVIAVVPERFRQAHIAGATLHATNGRANLLEVPVTVPMLRADGTEIAVHLEIRPQRLDADHCVFIATFAAT